MQSPNNKKAPKIQAPISKLKKSSQNPEISKPGI